MVLPAPVVPMAEVALIDEAAAVLGHDIGELMERAGAAIAAEAASHRPEGAILVLTGPGNNGGDGWVCARHLAQAGHEVRVWPVIEPRSKLCRRAADRARNLVTVVEGPSGEPALIVDAILGAGAKGPPRGAVAGALKRLAGNTCEVLAVDVPTGLGSEAMLANCFALCLQVAKAELLLEPRLRGFKTVDIGIDPAAYHEVHANVLRLFPPLRSAGHKGSHGELLVVGGGAFPGSLHFATTAALRTGCDQVRAFTADGPDLPPSIITHRQEGRLLAPVAYETLTPLIARASAVLIGPGIGREPGCPEAAQQAYSLATEMEVPVVVDADGIAALAKDIRDQPVGPVPTVITPHRAEARNLLGHEPTEEAVHAFARPDRVLLRKGRIDFISNGRRWVRNRRGNPRMAVGGTGDCLAGMTAGFMARGLTPFDAARLAAYWLTTTADELWEEQGPCYIPEDVVERLPRTLRRGLTALGSWPPETDA